MPEYKQPDVITTRIIGVRQLLIAPNALELEYADSSDDFENIITPRILVNMMQQ